MSRRRSRFTRGTDLVRDRASTLDTKDTDTSQASPQTSKALPPSPEAQKLAEEGDQFWDQEKFEDAEERYYQAYKLNPDFHYARFGLASCLLELGEAAEATPHFEALLEAEPHEADIWNHYGLALMDLREDDEALLAFNKAIALDNDMAAPYANRALILRDQRKLEDAAKAFEAFLERGGSPEDRERAEQDLAQIKAALERQEQSPPPRRRSPSARKEQSAPPNGRRASRDEAQPPRRRQRQQDEEPTPPRRRRQPQEDYEAPQRRRRRRSFDDEREEQRGRRHDDEMIRPRRRRRQSLPFDGDGGQAEAPRRRRRSREPDDFHREDIDGGPWPPAPRRKRR